MKQPKDFRTLIIWFLIVFVYTIVAMVFIREVAIPFRYSTSVTTDGHIPGDSQYYNSLALKKTSEIKEHGFAAFELRPDGQGTAGIASLLYLVVKSPYIIVLINALLHALSAVVFTLTIRHWFSLRTSIIATIPLVISPYMIIWFSQLNKDSYSLLGVILFVYGIIRLTAPHYKKLTEYINILLVTVVGILFIWIMRPYINTMLIPITSFILLISTVWNFQNKSIASYAIVATSILLCLVYFNSTNEPLNNARSSWTIEGLTKYNYQPIIKDKVLSVYKKCQLKTCSGNWLHDPLLPQCVNNRLQALMAIRCLNFVILDVSTNPTTLNSIIDIDRFPSGSRETLYYLSEAALSGIFSPWPNRWLYSLNHETSYFYNITSLEAAIMYLGVVGLVIFILRYKAWLLTIPISLAFWMMTIYGISHPFIGVMYRYRYPWWILMICLGTAACISLIQSWKQKKY